MSSNKKNNIIFLTHYFYPKIGGVEKHVYKISQQLTHQNHQITVITSRYNPQLREHEKHKNIKIIRIKLPNCNWIKPNKFKLWIWIIKHRQLFNKADIIHCHDVFFWYLPLRIILPAKPIYTTFHGYEGIYPPRKRAILIRKISEKLSWGNICVGKYIEKWYGTIATQVIYGATELPTHTRRPKTRHSAIFLGRLDRDTGLPQYLKALDILKGKKIKLNIEFCGGGALKSQAKKYGKVLGFQKNISTPLFKNRFAFVSSYLSILEAMAHKRLIFSIYNNHLKKDSLIMTPFKNLINIASSPQELTSQIEYYLNNPQKEKHKVNQAYQWVKNQTWDKITKQYLKLWKD